VSHFGSGDGNVLYLVVCGVPGAETTLERIRREQHDGWDVCVTTTERGFDWFDRAEVEAVSGHPVQSRMRRAGEPIFEPLGDRLVVSPASMNTIARIALGLADNMAVGLTCEALGRGIPVTIEAQVGGPFGHHPALTEHLDRLGTWGADVVRLDQPDP